MILDRCSFELFKRKNPELFFVGADVHCIGMVGRAVAPGEVGKDFRREHGSRKGRQCGAGRDAAGVLRGIERRIRLLGIRSRYDRLKIVLAVADHDRSEHRIIERVVSEAD